MTLEERLMVIEQKAKKDKDKKLEEENNLQVRTEEALHKVVELTPRIGALIILANKCIEEGVHLPTSTETTQCGYGESCWNFCADGFYHHVGFMNCRRGAWGPNESPYNKVKYLGIINGGACGVYDFYTNGLETFLEHEDHKTTKDAELKYLEEFLDEFDIFEEAFYKWIDSLAK